MFEKLAQLLRAHFPMDPAGQPYSPLEIMRDYGFGRQALLHASLFVPELVEVDGSVFITKFYPDVDEVYRELIRKYGDNLQELEESVNHAEIHYLFHNRRTTDEETDLLAEFVAEAWRGRLAGQFPGRTFNVYIDEPEDNPTVRFYEVRPLKPSSP